MIGILESIISRLKGVQDIVQTMHDSLKRLAGNGSANPLDPQAYTILLFLADTALSCFSKRTRQLDELSKAIEVEHHSIVAAIRRLVDLTEAFKMELANCL